LGLEHSDADEMLVMSETLDVGTRLSDSTGAGEPVLIVTNLDVDSNQVETKALYPASMYTRHLLVGAHLLIDED
jgi:hypothetical protein